MLTTSLASNFLYFSLLITGVNLLGVGLIELYCVQHKPSDEKIQEIDRKITFPLSWFFILIGSSARQKNTYEYLKQANYFDAFMCIAVSIFLLVLPIILAVRTCMHNLNVNNLTFLTYALWLILTTLYLVKILSLRINIDK